MTSALCHNIRTNTIKIVFSVAMSCPRTLQKENYSVSNLVLTNQPLSFQKKFLRRKFFWFFSFKKRTEKIKTIRILTNSNSPKEKKKHNRESIPSAFDIIRLIFRRAIKTVVRGCGVGAAYSVEYYTPKRRICK